MRLTRENPTRRPYAFTIERALAALYRAIRLGDDLEPSAQGVVGAGLRYRRALDLFAMETPEHASTAGRVVALKRLLHQASSAYNRSKRDEKTAV